MIKPRTLIEWTEVFGVELFDLEGFPNLKGNGGISSIPITLETFLQGFSFCKAHFEDLKKSQVLAALLE